MYTRAFTKFGALYNKNFIITLCRNKNYINENNQLYTTRLKRIYQLGTAFV